MKAGRSGATATSEVLRELCRDSIGAVEQVVTELGSLGDRLLRRLGVLRPQRRNHFQRVSLKRELAERTGPYQPPENAEVPTGKHATTARAK